MMKKIDLIHDFDQEVSAVLNACEKKVSAYPLDLREEGRQYLEKLHLLNGRNQNGGFSYLMPFWLREPLGLENCVCSSVALGNAFGLLYFMSQDEIMDQGRVDLLPLSNLFLMDFQTPYRALFPSHSPFWSYFNEYMEEWANSLAWERAGHFGRYAPYAPEDLLLLSRKAAPMKIPFAGLCLLSHRPELIPCFAAMVDYDQVAFQMIDDWRDWQEDIQSGHCTYLLSKVMEYCRLTDISGLQADDFRKAVFVGDVGTQILSLAREYNLLTVESITSVKSPYLHAYTRLVAGILKKISDSIQNEKDSLFEGGLNRLLWRLNDQ